MTHETKMRVKEETFAEFREGGVSMLRGLGLPFAVEDTWESVQKAADYVAMHANKAGEHGTAIMAAAMWMHGWLECQTMRKCIAAARLVDAEKAAEAEAKAEPAKPMK